MVDVVNFRAVRSEAERASVRKLAEECTANLRRIGAEQDAKRDRQVEIAHAAEKVRQEIRRFFFVCALDDEKAYAARVIHAEAKRLIEIIEGQR